MEGLISEIHGLIAKIEQAPTTPKPDKKLMIMWGDLAETAIETIGKNGNKEMGQLVEVTRGLLYARLNYIKNLGLY